MARKRRRNSLQDYRVDERQRQRRHRQQSRQHKGAPNASVTATPLPVSRASFRAQRSDLRKLVRETVDKALDQSRASLTRQLFALFDGNHANTGQDSL